MTSSLVSPYADATTTPRLRIGEVLVQQGLLTEGQLRQVVAEQASTPSGQVRRRLGAIVTDSAGVVIEPDLRTCPVSS